VGNNWQPCGAVTLKTSLDESTMYFIMAGTDGNLWIGSSNDPLSNNCVWTKVGT